MERKKSAKTLLLIDEPEPHILSTQPKSKQMVDMEKSTSRNSQIIGVVGIQDRVRFAQIQSKPINYKKLDGHTPTIIYRTPDKKGVGREIGHYNESHIHLDYPDKEKGLLLTQRRATRNVFLDVISRDRHFYNYSNFGKIGNTDGKSGKYRSTKNEDNEIYIPPSSCVYNPAKQKVDSHHCRDVHDFSKSGRDNIKVCGKLEPTEQVEEWWGGMEEIEEMPIVLKPKPKIKGMIELSKQLPRYNPLKEDRLRKERMEESGEESGEDQQMDEEVQRRKKRKRRRKKKKKKVNCYVDMKKQTGREATVHLGMNEVNPHAEVNTSMKNKRKVATLNMLYSSTTRYRKKEVRNQLKTADMLIKHSNIAINELRKAFPI